MNMSIMIMIFSSVLAAASQVLLKISSQKKYKNWIFEYLNIYVISSYFLLLLTMVMNVYAYNGINYKLGPVLTTLSYVFVLLFSKVILKEKLTKEKCIGMLCIIIGIIVFNI